MSASFEKVQEENEIEWRLEMANILVEIEMFNMGLLKFRFPFQRFSHRLRFFGKALTPEESQQLQPKWLHVLAPADRWAKVAVVIDDWSEWGKHTIDKLQIVERNLQKSGKDNVAELKQEFQKQIDDMKKEINKILVESQKPLLQEIAALKQQLTAK